MAAFWDTTGGLWMSGALIGKVGAAFTSTGAQHGGRNDAVLDHHQPLPYGYDGRRAGLRVQGPVGVSEVLGGSPYGATTIAGVDGSRQPHAEERKGRATSAGRLRRRRRS